MCNSKLFINILTYEDDVDSVEEPQNLCWTLNIAGQHNGDNPQKVVDGIRKAEADGI